MSKSQSLSRRYRLWTWIAVAGAAVVAGAVAVWLLWPESPDPTPRALEYRDFDVCVLVENRGVAGDPAAAAWVGLHEVVRDADVRLSYLSVGWSAD